MFSQLVQLTGLLDTFNKQTTMLFKYFCAYHFAVVVRNCGFKMSTMIFRVWSDFKVILENSHGCANEIFVERKVRTFFVKVEKHWSSSYRSTCLVNSHLSKVTPQVGA